MKYFKFILFFALAFILHGCCTKKACAGFEASMYVRLSGYTDNELRQLRVYTYDKTTATLLDSSSYSSYPDSLIPLRGNENMLQQETVIFKTAYHSDTISGITYTAVNQQEVCNECYPVGSDKETITTYKDYGYTRNGVAYKGDTVVLVK